MTGAPEGRRAVVAMSGGVDSSVAAALLRERGDEVIGVTLRLQVCHEARGTRSCCGVDGIVGARAVAGRLGIPHYVLDCVREFEQLVLRSAWDEYDRGRTPNPCILCNERIKFGLLLEWSLRLGAGVLATGHYARIEDEPAGGPGLLRGVDPGKDQSYFLAGLTREQITRTLFPVGHLTKAEVREKARSLGLPTAEAIESQDACLVGPGQRFADMLRERFAADARSGPLLDRDGRLLGRHAGIHRFTVGQRKGLPAAGGRRWVRSIRSADGTVVLTDREDDLLSNRLQATGMRWIGERPGDNGGRCEVQVRYQQAAVAATIERCTESEATVVLDRPVRAVTPGQTVVFYRGDHVLGRGWIDGCD